MAASPRPRPRLVETTLASVRSCPRMSFGHISLGGQPFKGEGDAGWRAGEVDDGKRLRTRRQIANDKGCGQGQPDLHSFRRRVLIITVGLTKSKSLRFTRGATNTLINHQMSPICDL
ncbi:hypothetical protein GQ600_11008 [Phytophthora cactorum]|nr:hypothetical protein GQ600_11008 [Phytophthora cactorum]